MSRLINLIKNILLSKSFDKVLAFFLSFFLWLFVVSGKSMTEKTTLNLSYKINPGLSFISPPAKNIKVRYQGPRALWGKIPEGETVEIDLSKFKRNKKRGQSYKIKRRDLPFVQGLNLVDFDLKLIEFSLDKKVKKTLPVVIKKMGTLSEQLKIDSINTSPEKVIISGASSLLKSLKEIPSEWIDLSNFTEGTYQKKLKLNIPKSLTANTDLINLSMDIRQKEAEKKEKIIPIQFISRGERFKPKSLEVKVTYQAGSGGFLDKEIELGAFVKIPENFGGQKIWAPVKIDVPKGVKVIDFTPRRVEIFD